MRDKLALVLPTLIIVAAEAMFYFALPETCLELHLLNIFLCIILSIFMTKQADLFVAFCLVSILRVLNIGMPKFFPDSIWFYPFIYLPVIVAGFMLWYVDNRPEGSRPSPKDIWRFIDGAPQGEKPTFRWAFLPIALIIGLGLSFIEFAILQNEPLIHDLSWSSLAALLVVMMVFVGFGEEMVFRSMLQTRVQARTGALMAVLFSSFMFSIMHSGYQSAIYMAYVFGVGLILGYSFYRTRSLVFITLIHGFLNFFLFSFHPLLWFPL
ncbi:MAG TPA: type II CAAX endopeptidase family protein [Methanomassiliicoccales archaeon]|nr:type II CAAX endopeptidase family protein [Methanomassiliicoccales archaeon]